MQEQERRGFIRLQAYHCVKYKLLSPEDREAHLFIPATIRDISGGGVCLRTEEALPESALIELKINFPHIATSIFALAKIIWTKQRDKVRRYDVGVEFVEIENAMRQTIDEQIKLVRDRLRKGK